jgi:hypothetical protein
MKTTDFSQGVQRVGVEPGWTFRSLMAAALALGTMTAAGCDEGTDDTSSNRAFSEEGVEAPAGDQECVSLFPKDVSSLHAGPPAPVAMNGFDFDNGNAPIEVVIPAVIPVIFGNVAPGDATIVLRFTTMLTNAWFDATAPYHPTAVGIYSNLGRRPASDSDTNANINIAVMYASYHTLKSLAPQHSADWDALMLSLGLDPNDDHEGTEDPIGIGNAAAKAMLAVKEHDGFNQLGFEGRTYNPVPYGDYTGYQPVNTAYDLRDPSRWQPSIRANRYGITRIQHFVTPQFALTLPYSYDDPSEWSTPFPTKSNPKAKKPNGNSPHLQAYRAQADEVLAISANLTDEQKVKAELFDDKIRSLGFSTLFMSIVNNHSVIDFIHYDFLVNAAAWDVGIIVWQEKTKYDTVRPFSAIEWLYGDQHVTAWGGPGVGTVSDLPANEWRPYLITADHPEYPSGSASFCGAHTQASRLFFGSDNLGWTVPVPAGSSVVEPGITPAQDTNLHFATWTDFEVDCGYSRMWGGVHFEDAVLAGFDLGNEIGSHTYDFVKAHIDGDV